MNEVIGFKAFKTGLINKYGSSFEKGVLYSKDAEQLKFGEHGHGYHIATNLADTFRFFNPQKENVYCEVSVYGKMLQASDYLYNCGSMYVVEKFEITKILSRQDILEYVFQSDFNELKRYFALYPFTKDELKELRQIIISKGKEYEELYQRALVYQQGDIKKFQRNIKYLRNGMNIRK